MGMDLSRRSQDRSLALKVCYLVISGKLEQGWLTEATKATKKAMSINPAGKAFRAGAFLTQIFKNKCAEAKPPLGFPPPLSRMPRAA